MPLTTKSEVKELLQIASTDTSKDALIDSLILKVQDFIIRRIYNFFVPDVYAFGSRISFTALDKSINDLDSLLNVDGLAIGNDITILGSYQNGNKLFSISSITSAKIIVNEAIVDEPSYNQGITIQRVQFTEDIKMAAAEFISNRMAKNTNVKSISLGDFSESYSDQGFGQKDMMNTFSYWKKVQWT